MEKKMDGRERGKNKEVKQGGKGRGEREIQSKKRGTFSPRCFNQLKKILNQNTLHVIIFMGEHIFMGKTLVTCKMLCFLV